MDTKTKQRLFTFLYIALIVGVLCFCGWMYFWLKSQGASCMSDPIAYHEAKQGLMCYCNDGLGWFNPRG